MPYLGVDVGASNITAAVTDGAGVILGRSKVRVRRGCTGDVFCDDIAAAVRLAEENAGVDHGEILSVGVGCPGAIDTASGVLRYSSNLGLRDLPLADELGSRLGMTVHIDNDANCAALGEAAVGAAAGADSVLVVTLGTGIGSGIIIGGRIYSGANGLAGEAGHMTVFPDGLECSCGRRGCWEVYASATALKHQTRDAMRAHPESLMWKVCPDLDRVSGKTSFEAKRLGDPAAAEVVDTYLNYVVLGLMNCINLLQPEVVCIGGGMSNEGDGLLLPLREFVDRYSFGHDGIPRPRLVLAALGGSAGLIGASVLGRSYL